MVRPQTKTVGFRAYWICFGSVLFLCIVCAMRQMGKCENSILILWRKSIEKVITVFKFQSLRRCVNGIEIEIETMRQANHQLAGWLSARLLHIWTHRIHICSRIWYGIRCACVCLHMCCTHSIPLSFIVAFSVRTMEPWATAVAFRRNEQFIRAARAMLSSFINRKIIYTGILQWLSVHFWSVFLVLILVSLRAKSPDSSTNGWWWCARAPKRIIHLEISFSCTLPLRLYEFLSVCTSALR